MFYTEDYPETKLNGTKFYKTICSLKEKGYNLFILVY